MKTIRTPIENQAHNTFTRAFFLLKASTFEIKASKNGKIGER